MVPRDEIVLGDCLDVLRGLPPACADLVVTDPPYGVGKEEHGWRDTGFAVEPVFAELFRILRDDTRLYVFCANRQLQGHLATALQCGFAFHQTLIWHRRNLVGGTRKSGWDWRSTYEPILVFHKGRPRRLHPLAGHRDGFDVRIVASPQSNFRRDPRVHVTQKPLQLLLDIMERSSDPGELVVDPFAGSGTTCVAARRLGRHFLGIEREPAYVAIARRRLGAEPEEAAV